jgi:hypothetical protein
MKIGLTALFEMLEFEVNTLQEVSKPVQSRDMSKINLPYD